MISPKTVVALGLLVASVSAGLHREQRGVLDDMWSELSSGLSQLQTSATEDISRIGQEIKPHVRQMESALDQAFSSVFKSSQQFMRNNPIFNNFQERVGQEEPVTEHKPVVLNQASNEGLQPAEPESSPEDVLHGLQNLFSEPMDPFRIFGISRRRWWDGPNVCVDRKVLDETEDETEEASPIHMDMTMTSCRDGSTFHECTTRANTNGRKKTVIVKHECCYGYTREAGELGCSGRVMDSLENTIKEVGAEEFLELLDTVDMRGWLDDNMTIFVPTDEAVEDFRHDLERLNTVSPAAGEIDLSYNVDSGLKTRRKRQEITIVEAPSLEDILTGHMVEGFIDSNDMHDEDVLHTMTSGDSKIRLTVYNLYPEKVIMANCAKVTSSDHYATNGIVHTVDKVILPTTKTIAQILATDASFQKLTKALTNAGLMDKLDQPGQYTLFAPSDEAFGLLDERTMNKIEAGNGCSVDILNNHILSNVICSGVIEGKAKTANSLKKYLALERDENDDIFVDGKKMLMRDIVGTNGIIHVMEEVIVPETARSVMDALDERGVKTMKELIELAEFDEDAFANKTLFMPTEKALKAMPSHLLDEIKADKTRLREFLGFHIAAPKTCKCDFEDNKLMPTGVEGKNLRLNTYGAIPLNLFELPKKVVTVQCARLTKLDDEVCGGMIHTVEKVLLPPGGKVIEIIKDSGRFQKFLELITFAELENELNTEGPYTLLAPTDDAFSHMDEEELKTVLEDKDAAIDLVKRHVISDMVCCSGIARHMPFIDLSGRRTQSGNVISLRKSSGGHIYAERSEVTTCDMVADNGVVHAIDRVMTERSSQVQERKSDSPLHHLQDLQVEEEEFYLLPCHKIFYMSGYISYISIIITCCAY